MRVIFTMEVCLGGELFTVRNAIENPLNMFGEPCTVREAQDHFFNLMRFIQREGFPASWVSKKMQNLVSGAQMELSETRERFRRYKSETQEILDEIREIIGLPNSFIDVVLARIRDLQALRDEQMELKGRSKIYRAIDDIIRWAYERASVSPEAHRAFLEFRSRDTKEDLIGMVSYARNEISVSFKDYREMLKIATKALDVSEQEMIDLIRGEKR